jgi:gliding motility-associated lipoprotein GldD
LKVNFLELKALKSTLSALLFAVVALVSCTEEVPTPKPHAFPRVAYPTGGYKPFEANYCAIDFEQPVYATVERDTTYFDEKVKSDCWFNLNVAALNATIHCSYFPIANRAGFDELVSDSYELVNKHTIKADYIEELPFSRDAAKVYGRIYDIQGSAASSCQFYVTDSTRHFLRGALYFKSQMRPDSMEPVINFIKKDIAHLVETARWR